MNDVEDLKQAMTLVLSIKEDGGEIWLEGDALKVNGPRTVMTDERRAKLGKYKSVLQSYLSGMATSQPASGADANAHPDIQPLQLGAGVPVICVPPLSGTPAIYTHLLPYFKDQPLYGLTAPDMLATGRRRRSVEAVASHFVSQMKAIGLSNHSRLLGFSLGGNIAFEMARQMLDDEGQKADLIVIDSTIGGCSDIDSSIDAPQPLKFWKHFFAIFFHEHPECFPGDGDPFWSMSLDDRMSHIWRLGQALNLPFDAFVNRQTLWNSYRFLFDQCASLDHHDPIPSAVRLTYVSSEGAYNPKMIDRWSRVAEGRVDLVKVPGNHLSIFLDEGHAAILGEEIRRCLTVRDAEERRQAVC